MTKKNCRNWSRAGSTLNRQCENKRPFVSVCYNRRCVRLSRGYVGAAAYLLTRASVQRCSVVGLDEAESVFSLRVSSAYAPSLLQ